MGVTFAFFQRSGTLPDLKDSLIIIDNGMLTASAAYLRKYGLIPSTPMLFDILSFDRCFKTIIEEIFSSIFIPLLLLVI